MTSDRVTGDPREAAVERRLDEWVRPRLRIHGGDVSADCRADGTVHVSFEGACRGCPLAPVTFKAVVEPALSVLENVEHVRCASAGWSQHVEARLEAAFGSGSSVPPA